MTIIYFYQRNFSNDVEKNISPSTYKILRDISIKFDVNWQLRHNLKNLLCSLFIQLHIVQIYLTFAIYILHTINARDIYFSTRTICSRARAETLCGGLAVVRVVGRWQPESSRTKQFPF